MSLLPKAPPPGSAAARFARLRGRPLVGDPLDRLAADVSAAANDLDEGLIALATDLARMEPDLDGLSQQAVALLALLSTLSVRQGSTRLPLRGPRARESLRELAVALLGGEGADQLLPRALALADAALDGAATPRADVVIGGPGDYRPLIVADDCLYQQRLLACEDRLVAHLRRRLHGAARPVPDADLDSAVGAVLAAPPYAGATPLRLSAEQQVAVRTAATRPLTIVSGGPGTGKTAIVVSMLRVLVRTGVGIESVALAAPTGKAAQRMRSSIAASLRQLAAPELFDRAILEGCPEAQTLHRLLGYSPRHDRYRHHDNNPLAQRVVVVDECSMIDSFLMERLVRALRPDAMLVLLGDADQLPSVDAGAVFRQLLPAAGDSESALSAGSVRLTRSYRMDPSNPNGRAILTAAQAVNAGRAKRLLGAPLKAASAAPSGDPSGDPTNHRGQPGVLVRRELGASTLRGAELVTTAGPGDVVAFVDRWFDQRVRRLRGSESPADDFDSLTSREYRLDDGHFGDDDRRCIARLFAHYEDARILTVTRGEGAGAAGINRRIHRHILARASVESPPAFYPGEPVMMRHNDYQRGIFNGDQGLILRVVEDAAEQHYRAVFPRVGTGRDTDGPAYAVFHLDALRHSLDLAFAMTVHKSQGSEFGRVALVLPATDMPLLTRELIYTALTRARDGAAIVGPEQTLRRGISRRAQRHSGLGDKLIA